MYGYIINLDSATARWQFVERTFSKTGIPFERVSGVNGKALTLPIAGFSESKYRRYHGKRPCPGSIGCYLSHIKAMEIFLASDHEYGLICEDDITPVENLKEILQAALKHATSWDILRLSGFYHGHPVKFTELGGGFSLAVNMTRLCGTGAYMIHRKAAETMVAKSLPMTVPYDHAIDREWVYGLKAAAVIPLPVDQQEHEFGSQIKLTNIGKLPAYRRYWTVFPYRFNNELGRVTNRALQLWQAKRRCA